MTARKYHRARGMRRFRNLAVLQHLSKGRAVIDRAYSLRFPLTYQQASDTQTRQEE